MTRPRVHFARTPSAALAIAAGGLTAGALDISAAIGIHALRGVSPVRILQSVAAGILGADAFAGGARTAALGLVLHFCIATGAAAVFWLASRRLRPLVEQPVPSGILYGVAVYLVMNLVVVPLSAARSPAFDPRMVALMVVVHIVCVGLPIALAVRRFG